MTKESICNSGHHCLSAIEVVRTRQREAEAARQAQRHHCLSAIEVVRTRPSPLGNPFRIGPEAPLPVGN